MPHSQRHAQCEFWQPANREAAEDPQSILRIDDEHQIAREKSDSACDEQEGPRSESPRCPKEEGKDQIELDEHGKVPPCRVQVHKVHRDIDEPESEQT